MTNKAEELYKEKKYEDCISLFEQILQEEKKALVDIEKQLPEHQVKTIMLVFQKHFNLNQGTVLLDKSDFDIIKSVAHMEFIDKAFPKHVGSNRREISASEANVLCIIEATISYFISKDFFNKKPKFDYK